MISAEQIDRFKKLFRGFTRSYGQAKATGEVRDNGKHEYKSWTVRGAIPPAAWEQHLLGTGVGLGVIALNDDSKAHWGAIDLDVYKVDALDWAKRLAKSPVVLCRSKSGGLHLFLFFAEPLPAELVVDKLKTLRAILKLDKKTEIFPKQIKRIGDDDAGNWINLPYHGKTRVAIHPDGRELTLAEFLDYAESKLVTAEMLEAMAPASSRPESPSDSERDDDGPRDFVDGPGPMGDGPPCLTTILNNARADGSLDERNNYLFNVAIYLKKKHEPADFWEELKAINAQLPMPLPEAELKATTYKSVSRRTYHYQCNKQPICAACKRKTCETRRFGVEPREKRKAVSLKAMGLNIGKLKKAPYDPPIWFMDINEVGVQFNRTDDMLNVNKFRVIVAEAVGVVIDEIRPPDFFPIMNALVRNAELLKVYDPSSPKNLFDFYLRQFAAQRVTREDPELVEAERVYRNGDHVQFLIHSLHSFLRNNNFIKPPNVINDLLRRYAATLVERAIKGGVVLVCDIVLPETRDSDYNVPTPAETFA